MKFHHLYQFIPTTGNINNSKHNIEFGEIKSGSAESLVRHDLWHKEGCSGKMICKVKLCSPTIVGNEQLRSDESVLAQVEQYKRDGQPALPANSLRGMIGAVLETLSQSSLRVLENKNYSVRKDVAKALKNIGKLTKDQDGWVIKPLDTLSVKKTLVGSLLDEIENGNSFYAKIDEGKVTAVITRNQWENIANNEAYKLGTLRVLNASANSVPPGRDSEIFILEQESPKTFSVNSSVINEFVTLILERQEATKTQDLKLPFPILGQPSWLTLIDGKWQPSEGITVYYDGDSKGVKEIAPSAVWRKSLNNDTYDFFRKTSKDLLPWSEHRTHLTPAEAMLGCVSSDGGETSRNLASRITFSDGLAGAGDQARQARDWVTLKILSSPKPPSPAMYFHFDTDNRWIEKEDLQAYYHTPNGRKIYLHHHESDLQEQPWKTNSPETNKKQKLRAKPISPDSNFYFSVDFSNLSKSELGLLKIALEPANNYQHRLGLGKSLGLGSVKVSIESLHLINREKRYDLTSLDHPRYHQAWASDQISVDKWEKRFPEEAATIGASEPISWAEISDTWLVDEETYKITIVAGDPSALQAGIKVMHPLKKGHQKSLEEEKTFGWFVDNNKELHHVLPAIDPELYMPTLNRGSERLTRPPKRDSFENSIEFKSSPAQEWLNKKLAVLIKVHPAPKDDSEILRSKPLAECWRDELTNDPELKKQVKDLIYARVDPDIGMSKKAKAIYNE